MHHFLQPCSEGPCLLLLLLLHTLQQVVVLTCPPLSEQPHNAAFQRTTEYNAALQQHLRSHHPGAAVADVHTAFVQFLQKHAARSKQLQMPVVRWVQAAACSCSVCCMLLCWGDAYSSAINMFRTCVQRSRMTRLHISLLCRFKVLSCVIWHPTAPARTSVQLPQSHSLRICLLCRFNVLSCVIWQPTAVLQHYLLHRSWDEISRLRGLQLLTDNVHINDTAAQLVAQTVQPFLQGVE